MEQNEQQQQGEQPAQPEIPTFDHTPKKGPKATYKVLGTKWHIPGKGVLTAADIATDAEAQKYLVDEAKAIGTVLEKVS